MIACSRTNPILIVNTDNRIGSLAYLLADISPHTVLGRNRVLLHITKVRIFGQGEAVRSQS